MRNDRRAELIEAAFHRVAQQGFEGLRLREVAEDVGIDHSTAYHHITNRQDLVLGVTRMVTDRLSLTMPRTGAPIDRLTGHFDELTRLCAEDPSTLTVSAEIDLRSRRDPAVAESLAQAEAGWRAALDGIFERGVKDGVWRTPDIGAARELVIAAVKGVRLRPDLAPVVLDQLRSTLVET